MSGKMLKRYFVTLLVCVGFAFHCFVIFSEEKAAKVPKKKIVKSLKYISGSTKKLEQLIGDYDGHLKKKTRNQTCKRYQIRGTDLGSSFEHQGKLIFLFGDTLGPGGGDCIAASTSIDPEKGLKLDFFTDEEGNYLKIAPNGVRMKGFEVPSGGINIQDRCYIFCTTDHSLREVMGRSVLVHFDEKEKKFTYLRDISERPQGKFINISARVAPDEAEYLPGKGKRVLMWGSGKYRASHCYLSCIAASDIEKSGKTKYFAGVTKESKPLWSDKEADAKPVVEHPVIGELSVVWCRELRLWLMTYNSRRPRGITLRYSRNPWGPWSEGIVIFHPWKDGGYRKFIRAGPLFQWGGAYGPYMIEKFLKVENNKLTLYYLMSTWRPYVVVLMKSQLEIAWRTNSYTL
jgi:hypothetical protein